MRILIKFNWRKIAMLRTGKCNKKDKDDLVVALICFESLKSMKKMHVKSLKIRMTRSRSTIVR